MLGASSAYKSICLLEAATGTNCKKDLGVLRFFDGTFQSIDASFAAATAFDRITEIMTKARAANGNAISENYEYSVGSGTY